MGAPYGTGLPRPDLPDFNAVRFAESSEAPIRQAENADLDAQISSQLAGIQQAQQSRGLATG